jgi:uncharacterized lipoprotein YmbA
MLAVGVWAILLGAGCASHPDHFYLLSTLPEGESGSSSAPTVHVVLNVTVPVLVDRGEMIVSTARNEILILDHERWAVPLSDQVSQTLARDIEKRRGEVLIGDRRFDRAGSAAVIMKVDIVRMTAQQGGRVSIEAHWRVVNVGVGLDKIGAGSYDAPVEGAGYAAIAKAYSLTLSGLADTLSGELSRP